MPTAPKAPAKPENTSGAAAPAPTRAGVHLKWIPHRQLDVLIGIAAGVALLAVSVLVTVAVATATSAGNSRDLERDIQTVAGALHSRLSTLVGQAAIEAARPDAFLNIYSEQNPAWFDAEWGNAARSARNFEFAAVTDDEGRILMGESSSGPLDGSIGTYIGHASEILDNLQSGAEAAGQDVVHGTYTRYEHALALVVATIIHGNVDQASIGPKERRLLVLAVRLSNEDLTAMSARYSLPRLRIADTSEGSAGRFEIRDSSGHRAGFILWDAQAPADSVLVTVLLGAALALLILSGTTVWGLVRLRRALAAREMQEEANWRLARFDALTGLPNVFGLEETLRQTLGTRSTQRPFAIAQIGIDGLAELGAAYGREVADRAFRIMAERVEKLAGSKVILARSGPAELTLAGHGPDSDDVTGRLARDILSVAATVVSVEKHQLRLGVSIGTADSDHINVLDTIKRGDIALAAARSAGGGRVIYFDPAVEDDRRRQVALDSDMRAALRNGAFEVAYQPIVDFATGQVSGAEAVLRWRRGETILSASEFMPAAERSGLVDELGLFALRRAAQDLASIPDITIGLDLWPSQLSRPELPERIQEVLREFSLAPERLQLEFSETFPIKAPGRSRDVMGTLRAANLHLALDGFGSGRSSVAFLSRLPFTRLKLDRALVANVDTTAENEHTVQAALIHAKKNGLRVIATGVERAEEAAVLTRLGCDAFQGPLFSRPLVFEAFVRLLQRRGPAAERKAG